MGRTVATFRELINQELRSWERVFGRALRKEERDHLELMFNRVRLYIRACTYEFPVHAIDGTNLTIGLDHEIRLRNIEAMLGIAYSSTALSCDVNSHCYWYKISVRSLEETV